MFKLIAGGAAVLVAAVLGLGSCTTLPTGTVGVKTSWSQISREEVPPGFTFKAPMFTSIDEYNVREATLDINDLTPKAKDNLSLNDLDVSILYEVNPARVADVVTEFAGQSPWDDEANVYMPGQGIVSRLSREAIYNAVSSMESLTIHQRRDLLANGIKTSLQHRLDTVAPNTFKVTNVAIRSITTDPSIEQSIRAAVQAQKILEQRAIQEKIAQANARIAVTKAEGEAKANNVLNQSLTPEILRKQQVDAMYALAQSNNATTIVLPSNATPLINVGNK